MTLNWKSWKTPCATAFAALVSVFLSPSFAGEKIQFSEQDRKIEIPPLSPTDQPKISSPTSRSSSGGDAAAMPSLPGAGASSLRNNKLLENLLDRKKNWLMDDRTTSSDQDARLKDIFKIRDYDFTSRDRLSSSESRNSRLDSQRSDSKSPEENPSDRGNRRSSDEPFADLDPDESYTPGSSQMVSSPKSRQKSEDDSPNMSELNLQRYLRVNQIGVDGAPTDSQPWQKASTTPEFGSLLGARRNSFDKPLSNGDAARNYIQSLLDPKTGGKQSQSSLSALDLINRPDPTRKELNPVTPSRFDERGGSSEALSAGRDPRAVSGLAPSVLDSLNVRSLGESSLAPAASAPSGSRLKPQPLVLEFPRRKF